MISNQILQNTIEGLKAITRIDLGVMDIEGKCLATTFSQPKDYEREVVAFVESPAESQVIQGSQFFKIYDEHQLEYILIANGGNDDVYMVGKIAVPWQRNKVHSCQPQRHKLRKGLSTLQHKGSERKRGSLKLCSERKPDKRHFLHLPIRVFFCELFYR